MRAQAGGVAGEGVGYLKSLLWWTGMTSASFLFLLCFLGFGRVGVVALDRGLCCEGWVDWKKAGEGTHGVSGEERSAGVLGRARGQGRG